MKAGPVFLVQLLHKQADQVSDSTQNKVIDNTVRHPFFLCAQWFTC